MYTHLFLYTLLKTDRVPDVDVSVYNRVVVTANSMEYSVLEGQVFGVVCSTQPQFSVRWYSAAGLEG